VITGLTFVDFHAHENDSCGIILTQADLVERDVSRIDRYDNIFPDIGYYSAKQRDCSSSGCFVSALIDSRIKAYIKTGSFC
jgi:hypothetical protein